MTDEAQNPEPTAEQTVDAYADPPPQPHVIESRPDEELRRFVSDYCDGRLFILQDLPNQEDLHTLQSVFMPLAFGALAGWTLNELKNIGTIYEDISKAGPLAINGMPMFFSFRMLNAADWQRVRTAIGAEIERRKNIPL